MGTKSSQNCVLERRSGVSCDLHTRRAISVFIPKSPYCVYLSFRSKFADFSTGNPINRRGWVLQERLLSHRILHFGQQVFWECRQLLACETFPEGLPKTIPKTMARAATQMTKTPTFDPTATSLAYRVKRKMTTSLQSPTTLKAHIPVPSFPSLTVHRDLFAWFYLAELYSACSLTRETDKLVAISGLAQIFGSPTFHQKASDVVAYLRTLALPRSGGAVTDMDLNNLNAHVTSHHAHIGSRPKGDYLAGLWRYELIPCLLWHVANGRQVDGSPTRRIEGIRAPSWSWASVNGLLHASIYQNWSQGIDGTILAEVEYASTTTVYETNPWGQVSEGMVRLWGKIIHEKDLVWPGHDELEDLRGGVRAHMSEVTAHMVRKIKRNSASVARLKVLRADVLCYMDDVEEFSYKLRHSGNAHEVGLLPLVGLQRRRSDWSKPEGYSDEVFEWHGLVVALRMKNASSVDLTQMAREAKGTAERLGYFRVRDTEVFRIVMERSEDREVTII